MNTMRMIAVITVGAMWQLAAPAGVAQAQPEEPAAADAPAAEELSPREARRKARELDREFQRLFQEEKYDDALGVLDQIMKLDPRVTHLYNLGLVHYSRGDKESSLDAFQRFLAEGPQERALAREARRFVRILERDVQIIREARRQSQSTVDDAERKATEASARAEQAEAARVEAEAAAADARQAQAKSEAERDRMREVLASTPSGVGAGKRTLGVSLALVGGVALGVGAFYGLDARAANSEAESVEQWTVGHDWLVDRAEGYQTRSLIFGIAGAGLIAAGATLYYLGEREAQAPLTERVQLGVAPSVSPGAAGVAVHGRF
ncbi:tetratricopeptide repeat protein [Haliangium sp.]|uniref:tetratricopeptide repeat protein n=1 Tax=Haliangium sp. TaxID=2663208 RepID=UPI003D1492C1